MDLQVCMYSFPIIGIVFMSDKHYVFHRHTKYKVAFLKIRLIVKLLEGGTGRPTRFTKITINEQVSRYLYKLH